jgi:hypothetical protein
MIQHFVSAVIMFLIIEMAFNYGFFQNYNANGYICNLSLIISLLSAWRDGVVERRKKFSLLFHAVDSMSWLWSGKTYTWKNNESMHWTGNRSFHIWHNLWV